MERYLEELFYPYVEGCKEADEAITPPDLTYLHKVQTALLYKLGLAICPVWTHCSLQCTTCEWMQEVLCGMIDTYKNITPEE